MGSRVTAALLRRGREQASALLTPRLPRTTPAPVRPRVGATPSSSPSPSCGGGGGGGCLLPPRPGPAGAFSPASRLASFYAFRSLAPKVSGPLRFPHASLHAVTLPPLLWLDRFRGKWIVRLTNLCFRLAYDHSGRKDYPIDITN
jgi:hypothetical protein